MIAAARVTKEVCDDFVARLHRHHDASLGHRFLVGAWDVERDKLCGVGVVGRPVARGIDQDGVVEVTRNCTDGTRNACSFVYARAADVARASGFRAIITYTLTEEPGCSLRALGWWGERLDDDDGRSWSNRADRDEDHVRAGWRWLCLLNSECFVAHAPEIPAAQLELVAE